MCSKAGIAMLRWLGSVLLMTVLPLEYLAITMMDTYAKFGDARETKIGVPKRRVGSGERDLLLFQYTSSVRWLFPPLQLPSP